MTGECAERVIYWGSGSTPAWKALACLEEKKLSYTSNCVEFSKAGHKSPEIMALNPRGQVPTFDDNGIIVNESLAILLYLEEAYPSPTLMPGTPGQRAQIYQRLIESGVLQEKISAPMRIKLFSKNPDMVAFKEKAEAVKEELKFWEGYVKDGFVVGENFTLADVALGPIVLALIRFGATFKEFPNLAKYAETIKARPSIAKTAPPHWATSPNQTFLADGSAPAWKPLACLEEKKLSYMSKCIEFDKDGHKCPEIMALNPRGQVPTFNDNGIIVNESLAILLYLEEAYPSPTLMPGTPGQRAQIYQRLIESSVLQEAANGPLINKLFSKEPDEAAFKEKAEALTAELKLWEKYVNKGYVVGSTFTLADVAVGPIVLMIKRLGATYKAFPNLAKYAETMKARPSIAKTYPPHWATSPNQSFLNDYC